MNQDFYKSNSSGFDQFQPSQFPVNYPPQETSKEILQARDNLIEAIQAFLKEYNQIPPNEKCMALLLAEERFLKIKQAMEEEQNQPEKKPTSQSSIPYWNFSMIDDEEARDNFLKDVCTFLRKFSRIPFGVTPKVILIAWESFGKFKDALTDKQYRQDDIQELMSKLLEDVQTISEEFSEYINYPSWNRPLFYFDEDDDEYTVIWRRPNAITPDKPSEEPEDPLIMGEEELSTIPEKDNLVFDDDSFENIDYVEASPPDSELVSLEEVEDIEPDQGGLTSVVISDNSNDSLLELPKFESFHFDFDPSFLRPPPKPPVVRICLHFEPDAPLIDNFNELNDDQEGGKIDFSQNVEDDDSFTFVIWTFLPFLTYLADSPLLLSTGSEDTIFDPGIST
ncbi:hypothetical protein Tco_0940000 [Tanacetum coccineum]|uniref:Uncharacterized protein n=1 Tax=Tanacetum coccineum TaxID=301880 RepID=A0ABQ5DM73_9ASTR